MMRTCTIARSTRSWLLVTDGDHCAGGCLADQPSAWVAESRDVAYAGPDLSVAS